MALRQVQQATELNNVRDAIDYTAACALTCAVWDHVLTINDEITYIWVSKKLGFTRVSYMFNRYGIEIALMVFVHWMHSTTASDDSEIDYLVAGAVFIILSVSVGNVIMTFRLYALWDRTKAATIILWTGFAGTYLGVIVSSVISAQQIYVSSYSQMRCVITKKPTAILGTWICMLAFDIFAVVVVCTNALQQPYRHTSDVTKRLRRDGISLYLGLATIRMINIVLTIVLPAEGIFTLLFLLWVVTSIATSRLILRMEAMKLAQRVDNQIILLNRVIAG